nr:retrovirus-related Pol polyprotein from transposon TNT 1-94 [Tanacetum cinerariifolium]
SIFINQSKYALKLLKKYGFESCDLMDTPMVKKSKLDEDKEGKAVDPSHYRGMIGTLLYLTANRPDLQFAIYMYARYQARPIEKHIMALDLTKFQCTVTIKVLLPYAAIMSNTLGLNTSTSDIISSKSRLNGVIELYFVNIEYQLTDLFTKALGRERIEFLINKLGMRSFKPETLKKLMNEEDE